MICVFRPKIMFLFTTSATVARPMRVRRFAAKGRISIAAAVQRVTGYTTQPGAQRVLSHRASEGIRRQRAPKPCRESRVRLGQTGSPRPSWWVRGELSGRRQIDKHVCFRLGNGEREGVELIAYVCESSSDLIHLCEINTYGRQTLRQHI